MNDESSEQEWLKRLQFPQTCHQCGQDFAEEGNYAEACSYHPGQFAFSIISRPKRDALVLLEGWDCCAKNVRQHTECSLTRHGSHLPQNGAVTGVVPRATVIDGPVVIDTHGTRYVVGQTTTACCKKPLLTVPGCITDCHRGSLTLASQHEGVTGEEQAFANRHKAAYRQRKSQEPLVCTRCKCDFRPGQQGGCQHHPGALAFTCKNEGTANERYIFDHFECCHKTVYDSPGCRAGGHHASSAIDTKPFQCGEEACEEACTKCCRKTMDHVPGCRPTDHVSDSAEVQFAMDEATHVFYTNRFMTSVSRYVRNAHSVVPPVEVMNHTAARRVLHHNLSAHAVSVTPDTGKTVKCCICWEDYAWGGVVDGSSTTNRLTEDQATCCPVGKHLYCQSCLQGHVQSKVDNLVTSIVCPQVQDCTSRAWTPREIDCFVDREVFAIYDKFLLESAASAAGSVVSCPACGDYSEFQPKTDTDAYPLQPVQLFRCIKCLQVSCLQCRDAVGLDLHVQHECATTIAAARRRLEEVLTQAGMLICPKCDTSIVKESGCNHMTCSKCRTHLCLLCCEVVAEADSGQDPYLHFREGSPCWVFDNARQGQTEHAAMQRRQIAAANMYIASLEPAMALQVISNNPLLSDFPTGSIMISAR